MSARPSTRARNLAGDLLERVPPAYCSVMRRRHPEWLLVERTTDIVLEGYQSSGNTFGRKAMEHANPGTRIASHSHSWAHVAQAVRLGKPVVVLLRPPVEAIASHVVRMRLEDLDGELRRYRRFYRRVTAMSASLVMAPFDVTVGRFGDVVRRVNLRFGTAFNVFDHDDPQAKAAVFAEMEREAASTPAELDRLWRIARPNPQRAQATGDVRRRLEEPRYRLPLARCEELHEAARRSW